MRRSRRALPWGGERARGPLGSGALGRYKKNQEEWRRVS